MITFNSFIYKHFNQLKKFSMEGIPANLIWSRCEVGPRWCRLFNHSNPSWAGEHLCAPRMQQSLKERSSSAVASCMGWEILSSSDIIILPRFFCPNTHAKDRLGGPRTDLAFFNSSSWFFEFGTLWFPQVYHRVFQVNQKIHFKTRNRSMYQSGFFSRWSLNVSKR